MVPIKSIESYSAARVTPPPRGGVRLPLIGIFVAALSSLVLMAGETRAADYHFCDCRSGAVASCPIGSDQVGDGTAERPWRSIQRARSRFQSMNAGDSIRLCRGGRFSAEGVSSDWDNPSCRADNHCRFEDYTPAGLPADLPRPVIHRSSGVMFNFSENNGPPTRGVTITHIDFVCSPCNEGGPGVRIGEGAGDLTFDDVTLDGFFANFYIKHDGAAQSNITIQNSRILNGKNQGVLGGSPNLQILNNYFENNGGVNNVLDHSIYLSGDSAATGPEIPYNMVVRGNEVYKTSHVGGACTGVAIVAHGYLNGVIVEDNYIHEDPGTATRRCYGISFVPGHRSETEKIQNIIIRRNLISNLGRVGVSLGAVRDSLVENNVIVNNSSLASQAAVYVQDVDEVGGFRNENVTIRNNSIFFEDSDRSRGVQLESMARRAVVANNAIYIGNGGRRTACFRLDRENIDEMDNNLCFLEQDNGNQWVSSAGSLATWQEQTGFDENSIRGRNPDFSDPAATNLRAASAESPMVGAGSPAMAASNSMPDCTAVQGEWVGSCPTPLLRGTTPDIGAYQFHSSGAVPKPPAAPVLLPLESAGP